ncbi:DUF4097 family beta strand repeat-containing protein [Streptomyces sp. TE33382]
MFVVAGGVVLLAAVLSACGGTNLDDAPVERKSFGLTGRTLTIAAENSSVELVPADVRRVEVERQVDGWVMLGSGPDPVWRMKGDTLTLGVTCDAVSSDCVSRHRVKVPRDVTVKVDADNGRVSASGFATPLELFSDNGGVVVRDARGPLKLGSDNGSILAERISATSVITRSDNGSVRLKFSGVPDLVDSVTDNGGVTIDLPAGNPAYAVSATTDNGTVSVDVPRSDTSTHVVKVRTDNGQVTVRSAN